MTWFDVYWQALQETLLPFAPLLNSPLPLMIPLLVFLFGSFDPRFDPRDDQNSKQADVNTKPKRRLRRRLRRRSENNIKIQLSIWAVVLAIYYNFIGTLNSSIYISVILGIAAVNIDKLVYFLRFNAYSNTRARAERLVGEDSTEAYLAEADLLEAELTHRNVSSITAAKIRATVGSSRRMLALTNPDLDWLQGQLEEARVLLRLPSSEEIALLRTFFFFVASLTFIIFQFVVAGYAFDPLFVTTVLQVEFFGVPAVLIIWSAIGSVASLLNEYVSEEGSIIGDSRSLFFKPILSVILSSISYFAISALFPGLFADGSGEGASGLVGIIGIDDPERFRAQFAFLSVFGFLTGFYEEISYNFLLEAKKRFYMNKPTTPSPERTQTTDITLTNYPEMSAATYIEVDSTHPDLLEATTRRLRGYPVGYPAVSRNTPPADVKPLRTYPSSDDSDSNAASDGGVLSDGGVSFDSGVSFEDDVQPVYFDTSDETTSTASQSNAAPATATTSADAARAHQAALSAAAFAVNYRRLRQANCQPVSQADNNPTDNNPADKNSTTPARVTPSRSVLQPVRPSASQSHSPIKRTPAKQPPAKQPPTATSTPVDDTLEPDMLLKELKRYQHSQPASKGDKPSGGNTSSSTRASNTASKSSK